MRRQTQLIKLPMNQTFQQSKSRRTDQALTAVYYSMSKQITSQVLGS